MLKKILHIALFLCLALAAQAQYLQATLQGGPPAPGPRTRTPLNALERAANNLEGVTTLTDTFGNLRLALYVHVEDTCINYRPAATGNTQNLSAFVKKCSTDSIWYIDFSGRSIFLGEALTIQQIVDSIAADTALQYNWYTTDATTTNPLRTATILGSAQWLGDAPDGSIYFEMGSLGGGRALIDTAAAVYHSGLGGLNIVQTDAQGIDIATSNTASRAVNVTTDTLNMSSAFDPDQMIVNLNALGSYFKIVDDNEDGKSLSVGVFNQFPSEPSFSGDEIGLYINPAGTEVSLFASTVYAPSSDFTYLTLSESSFGTTAESANGLSTIGGSTTSVNATISNTATSFGTQRIGLRNSTGSGTVFFAGQNAKAPNVAAYTYLGTVTNTGGTNPIVENRAWGVQTLPTAAGYKWLNVLLPNNTLGNNISFYDSSYLWVNATPSPTLGDTSFHYWAGNGTTTNPGFITLAQVQAGVPNWYNSNGTTTDNTRIATVTETATWLSADVTADGVYPFRFQLAGVSPNEPEMMVWDFPAGDSLTLSQSDQEIVFFSNNFLASRTNEAYTVQADSFQYNPNLGGTAFKVGRHNVVTQNAETGTPTHRDAIEYRTITGTAQTELFLDGSSAVWVVPTNAATNFKIHVSAICSDAGNGVGISTGDSWASWHLGGIKRVGSTTSLVGTVQTPATAQSDAGMSTSVVTIDADDTDESLRVRFTPPSTAGSTTVIRVIATLEITQTSY